MHVGFRVEAAHCGPTQVFRGNFGGGLKQSLGLVGFRQSHGVVLRLRVLGFGFLGLPFLGPHTK